MWDLMRREASVKEHQQPFLQFLSAACRHVARVRRAHRKGQDFLKKNKKTAFGFILLIKREDECHAEADARDARLHCVSGRV